jgi:hypothetical protein
MGNTTRQISGRRIVWTDLIGTTHSCQCAEAEPGIFLVWTDCGKDVPPNGAHLELSGELVTCIECRSRVATSDA